MKIHTNGFICTLLLTTTLLCSGCRYATPPNPEAAVPLVRVVKPTVKEVTEYAYFTGRMDAVQSVDIRARVTGYLEEIKFTEGQFVNKGDLLFKIDPRPYKAAADQAHSQIALAEARLDLAKANFNRMKDIAKTPGAVSQQEVDTTSAMLKQANAELQAARATAESADLNLKWTDVDAPISGIISRTFLTVGNLISQNTTLLTTIVSQDPIYAYFDVDERAVLRYQQLVRDGEVKSVRKGETVPVELGLANEDDKYPHTGYIEFVDNRLNTLTGTLSLRGVFQNPEVGGKTRTFTPGLFVRVRMPIGEPHKAMVIPQSAIQTDQGQKYVLVVNDQNLVEKRSITTGPEEPNGMQVVIPAKALGEVSTADLGQTNEQSQQDLTPNDRVIVSRLQTIRSGAKVLPKPET